MYPKEANIKGYELAEMKLNTAEMAILINRSCRYANQ